MSLKAILTSRLSPRPTSSTRRSYINTLQLQTQRRILVLARTISITVLAAMPCEIDRDFRRDRRRRVPVALAAVGRAAAVAVWVVAFAEDVAVLGGGVVRGHMVGLLGAGL